MTDPPRPELATLSELGARAARRAGDLLLDGYRATRTMVGTKSSITDMVTEMDHAAEKEIVELLLHHRPDDGVLGEEGASRDGTSGVRWIIDPLDGTTNYLYGFPAWAVSIATEVDGEVTAGVVHDPLHDEMYTAVRSAGAYRNDQRLHVAGPPTMETALVATGFGYGVERRRRQSHAVGRVLAEVRDLRRAGAAALDLCWVAAGRVDLYYEQGLSEWDYAAGALIAAEAGAWVGDLDGGPPSRDMTIAAVPQLATAFRTLLQDAMREPT